MTPVEQTFNSWINPTPIYQGSSQSTFLIHPLHLDIQHIRPRQLTTTQLGWVLAHQSNGLHRMMNIFNFFIFWLLPDEYIHISQIPRFPQVNIHRAHRRFGVSASTRLTDYSSLRHGTKMKELEKQEWRFFLLIREWLACIFIGHFVSDSNSDTLWDLWGRLDLPGLERKESDKKMKYEGRIRGWSDRCQNEYHRFDFIVLISRRILRLVHDYRFIASDGYGPSNLLIWLPTC